MSVRTTQDFAMRQAGDLKVARVDRSAGHFVGSIVTDGPGADYFMF